MDSRNRVLTAIARREPDRVPMNIRLVPYLIENLREKHGVEDIEEYLKMDIRYVEYNAKMEESDFSAYTANFHHDTVMDDWGCGTYPVGYYHFTKAEHPMKDILTIKEIEKYPFPKREANVEVISKNINTVWERELLACSQYEGGVFEQGNSLMGMEKLLINMYTNPELVKLLFDRISDVKARMAAAFTKAGVDILWIGDDIGMQTGPLLDIKMWREFILPHLRKVIKKARSIRPDIQIAYHSCGSIAFAIEDLIEAGIDILESIQPEVNDCASLKRKYGNYLSFWGGVGSQSTMSHGTDKDVKNEIKHLIKTVGKNGGYICSPAHKIEPETPLENIYAFVEAVEEYGYYK